MLCAMIFPKYTLIFWEDAIKIWRHLFIQASFKYLGKMGKMFTERELGDCLFRNLLLSLLRSIIAFEIFLFIKGLLFVPT